MSKRTRELTSSIVPRGTSFHRSVELEFLLCCCFCGPFPGPAELSAINPYAVQDHSQPTGQGDDRLFRARATIAFFIPRRLAICIAQALSHDHFFERSML